MIYSEPDSQRPLVSNCEKKSSCWNGQEKSCAGKPNHNSGITWYAETYSQIHGLIIEAIFRKHFRAGQTRFEFERHELETIAKKLKIELPKNLGDLIYSFKFRANLPASIVKMAPPGKEWIIRSVGRAKYQFALTPIARIVPNPHLVRTKILDATPGMIAKYATNDEQALLAKVRYNRLIDVFTGVTCFSLQNHWRTTTKGIGQVEIDEIYIGVNRHGAHFVFPIQAKAGRDQIGMVQVEQDIAVCRDKFPNLTCRSIATQFMSNTVIALFELG